MSYCVSRSYHSAMYVLDTLHRFCLFCLRACQQVHLVSGPVQLRLADITDDLKRFSEPAAPPGSYYYVGNESLLGEIMHEVGCKLVMLTVLQPYIFAGRAAQSSRAAAITQLWPFDI